MYMYTLASSEVHALIVHKPLNLCLKVKLDTYKRETVDDKAIQKMSYVIMFCTIAVKRVAFTYFSTITKPSLLLYVTHTCIRLTVTHPTSCRVMIVGLKPLIRCLLKRISQIFSLSQMPRNTSGHFMWSIFYTCMYMYLLSKYLSL